MIKKYIFLIVSLMGLFSCAKKDDKITTIQFFQYRSENLSLFEELSEIYEKENPDVNIDVMPIDAGRNYSSELKLKKSSDKMPTIFNIGNIKDLDEYKDYLTNLNDFNLTKIAKPRFLKPMQIENDTYAVPCSLEGYGFLINKKIFENAGVDWRDINNYQKLLSAVETIDKQKDKLNINAVFAMAGAELWTTGLHDSQIFLSSEFEGNLRDVYNASEINFTYASAFKNFIDMQVKYAVAPVNGVNYTTQVENLFALGKVAIIKQGSWVFDSIAIINPELSANLGFLPLSSLGMDTDKIMVSSPMYWAVNNKASDKEKEASLKFLNWLYTSDVGKDYIIHRLAYVPPYSGFESPDLQSKNPLWQDINRYVKSNRTIDWVFSSYPKDWGMMTLGKYISSYIDGNMNWDSVISESKKAWFGYRLEEKIAIEEQAKADKPLIKKSNKTKKDTIEKPETTNK